jgi:hypothetical protein
MSLRVGEELKPYPLISVNLITIQWLSQRSGITGIFDNTESVNRLPP